jgi:hypothetical protein
VRYGLRGVRSAAEGRRPWPRPFDPDRDMTNYANEFYEGIGWNLWNKTSYFEFEGFQSQSKYILYTSVSLLYEFYVAWCLTGGPKTSRHYCTNVVPKVAHKNKLMNWW